MFEKNYPTSNTIVYRSSSILLVLVEFSSNIVPTGSIVLLLSLVVLLSISPSSSSRPIQRRTSYIVPYTQTRTIVLNEQR